MKERVERAENRQMKGVGRPRILKNEVGFHKKTILKGKTGGFSDNDRRLCPLGIVAGNVATGVKVLAEAHFNTSNRRGGWRQ